MRTSIPSVEAPSGVLPAKFAFETVSAASRADMTWDQPVGASISILRDMVDKNTLEGGFWQPSRVLKAIIDSSLTGADRIKLTSLATDFAIGMYAGKPDEKTLDELAFGLNFTGLLKDTVIQKDDSVTSAATAARLSKRTHKRLARQVDEPSLMIAIGHGGYVATLQTLLYRARKRSDTVVYPIRYSTQKYGDKKLHLPDTEEVEHIQELAKGRTIVVHDEDAYGGDTLVSAIHQLRTILPQDTRIIGVVNKDERYRATTKKQGRWWQKS